MDTIKLRLQGYSADASGGIICRRDSARFVHERTGIIRVEAPRELVDAVIAAIDEPRALVGTRRGGAVLLFKVDGGINNDLHKLALRDGTEITITSGSDNQSLNPDDYSWPRGRSPLDVRRDDLPPLFDEFLKIASDAAWTFGARPAEEFERERATEARVAAFKADVAAGKIKLKTDAEIADEAAARADAETVAQYEGKEVRYTDGVWAELVISARKRFAWRKQKQTDAA